MVKDLGNHNFPGVSQLFNQLPKSRQNSVLSKILSKLKKLGGESEASLDLGKIGEANLRLGKL